MCIIETLKEFNLPTVYNTYLTDGMVICSMETTTPDGTTITIATVDEDLNLLTDVVDKLIISTGTRVKDGVKKHIKIFKPIFSKDLDRKLKCYLDLAIRNFKLKHKELLNV